MDLLPAGVDGRVVNLLNAPVHPVASPSRFLPRRRRFDSATNLVVVSGAAAACVLLFVVVLVATSSRGPELVTLPSPTEALATKQSSEPFANQHADTAKGEDEGAAKLAEKATNGLAGGNDEEVAGGGEDRFAVSLIDLPSSRPSLGQEELVGQIDPSVVTILLDDSQGSGFVVDGKGLIVTNYHVIEGAQAAKVVLPDKTSFPVEGFVAIDPGKDLALLQIQVGAKQLQALNIAENPPSKGEQVFAFGAPLGLSGSVSNGIVAALRPGEDVRETLRKLANRDIYDEILGYDLDAEWLQTTAPVSPGNSGGPLVNARGEVVGINTWVYASGQNLNFALSAVHITQLVASAGGSVQPLSKLPQPRPEREERRMGDAQKTLALWKKIGELKTELNRQTAACERRLRQIRPVDPRNPMKGLIGRLKKQSAIYDELSTVYREYANEVKSLETDGVDPEVVVFTVAEADLTQRISDAYQQLSTAAISQSPGDVLADLDEFAAGIRLRSLRRAAADLRTVGEVLRVRLSRKYDESFPALGVT